MDEMQATFARIDAALALQNAALEVTAADAFAVHMQQHIAAAWLSAPHAAALFNVVSFRRKKAAWGFYFSSF
jgi:hypothetical protein